MRISTTQIMPIFMAMSLLVSACAPQHSDGNKPAPLAPADTSGVITEAELRQDTLALDASETKLSKVGLKFSKADPSVASSFDGKKRPWEWDSEFVNQFKITNPNARAADAIPVLQAYIKDAQWFLGKYGKQIKFMGADGKTVNREMDAVMKTEIDSKIELANETISGIEQAIKNPPKDDPSGDQNEPGEQEPSLPVPSPTPIAPPNPMPTATPLPMPIPTATPRVPNVPPGKPGAGEPSKPGKPSPLPTPKSSPLPMPTPVATPVPTPIAKPTPVPTPVPVTCKQVMNQIVQKANFTCRVVGNYSGFDIDQDRTAAVFHAERLGSWKHGGSSGMEVGYSVAMGEYTVPLFKLDVRPVSSQPGDQEQTKLAQSCALETLKVTTHSRAVGESWKVASIVEIKRDSTNDRVLIASIVTSNLRLKLNCR